MLPNSLTNFPVFTVTYNTTFDVTSPTDLLPPFWFFSFMFFSAAPLTKVTTGVGGIDLFLDVTTKNVELISDNKEDGY